MSLQLEPNAKILFQGDSITDAGRNRAVPGSLGGGYALLAAANLGLRHPDRAFTFWNRGVGGDRVKALAARWQTDCLDLRPTWVSIMIGINDTWRRYDSADPTSTESYETDYRRILTQVRDSLGARLILLEPFVLPVPEDRRTWREDLDPRIAVVHKLAKEFNALLVPLDKIFAEHARKTAPAYWAADGVHPTPAGHALIAESWLKAVGE